HSSQMDITDATLSRMPVPQLSEDQRELLAAIGTALSACACQSRRGYGIALQEAMHAYLSSVLLRGLDEVLRSAAGLTHEEWAAVDNYLAANDEPRPGLITDTAGTPVVVPVAAVRDGAGAFRSTTGLVLAI